MYKQYSVSFSDSSFHTLSIYALFTKEEIIRFISFVLVFIAAINTFDDKRQFKRVILTIILISLGLTLYGILKKYFILGRTVTTAFSTFGNRNHYAAYMVMVAPLTVGYALSCQNKFHKFILSFLCAIFTVGIFLSLSRAGVLSVILSFMLLGFLLMQEKATIENWWVLALPILLGAILLFMAGSEPLNNRLTSLLNGSLVRGKIFGDSLRIIKDFPLSGVGLGDFNYIFTIYQKSVQSVYYKYLHNEYIQLIIETGIIASFFYLYFIFKIFKDILLKLKQRHDPFVKNIVMGGMCGLIGVMTHSLVDYNFHIPAISILFWFLAGLIYKCVYTHFIAHSNTNCNSSLQ